MGNGVMKDKNKRVTSTNRRRIGNLRPSDLVSKMGCIISPNRGRWGSGGVEGCGDSGFSGRAEWPVAGAGPRSEVQTLSGVGARVAPATLVLAGPDRRSVGE